MALKCTTRSLCGLLTCSWRWRGGEYLVCDVESELDLVLWEEGLARVADGAVRGLKGGGTRKGEFYEIDTEVRNVYVRLSLVSTQTLTPSAGPAQC